MTMTTGFRPAAIILICTATALAAAALTPPIPGNVGAPPDVGAPPNVGAPPIATPSPAAPMIDATLSDLAFLAGRWQGRGDDGAFLEEHWSAPEGSSMMGMFRWVHPGGAPALFEILTLTDEPAAGVTMRLRHFSPTLEAKEDKDKPMTLRLAELDGTRAVFAAAADAGQADRVIYERTTPDTLVFTLHFREDANRDPLTLEFTREASTPPPHSAGD